MLEEIFLRMRFGNITYRVPFIVAERLRVEVNVATRFMNRYVHAIEYRSETIRLDHGSTIPILSRRDVRRPHEILNHKPNDSEDTHDRLGNVKRTNDATFNEAHTTQTARTFTIPMMSQLGIPVVTKASVYIEPNLPVQMSYKVRTADGIKDVRPDVNFELFSAKFSKSSRRLPKGMTIAYAKRNPLATLTVPQ